MIQTEGGAGMPVSHEHIMAELERVNQRLDKGGEQFNEILASQVRMESEVKSALGSLKDYGVRITTLEASENVRRGERGVWSGILSSKAFAWVATAFAALLALFTHYGSEGLK
ncbi:MAG: hypothetical protein IPG83_02485 [Novosphingobium sp.]|nr:hypothetical protein [Novosphingobium sp.]